MSICLAVHGGAWNVPDADVEPHLEGVREALTAGWAHLKQGVGAVDVVERTIRILEDNPVFNAGRGSHLNRLGTVELDASIMEGGGLEAGAVAAVQRVRHPISLARKVMEQSAHVLLVGDGAYQFAEEHGVELCRARDLLVGRSREQYLRIRAGETDLVDTEFAPSADDHMGTVGAVAYDARGLCAAGTSTGGTLDKYPGRVGDSPLIGAGTYADATFGAASCTGWGEGILRIVMAKSAIDALAAGHDSEQAAGDAVQQLDERVQGKGGLILVGADGSATAAFNTPRMARGLADERAGMRVGVGDELLPCPVT